MPEFPCSDFDIAFSFLPCLAPVEKASWLACIAIRVGGMFDFIPKSAIDNIWTAAGETVGNARYNQFILCADLRLGTIGDEGEETEVYFMDSNYWLVLMLYTGCEGYKPFGPCFELEYGR